MYIFSILAVVLLMIIMMACTGSLGMSMLACYIDMPSLILLIVLCVPMLISSGLMKDFNRAFKIGITKNKEVSLTEIKRSIEAVELVMKVLIYGAVFILIFTLIIILRSLNDLSHLGPNLAVAVLPLIYALALELILIPLKSRLRIKMMEFMGE